MIIVSACLAGINCKYDGGNNYNRKVAAMVAKGEAIPVCPEQLGGCPTPRQPCEIAGGKGTEVLDKRAKVIDKEGRDLTCKFIKGAHETLKIAELTGAKAAILKDRSPSCGIGSIYDGTFSDKIIAGNGVTAELLLRKGIKLLRTVK